MEPARMCLDSWLPRMGVSDKLGSKLGEQGCAYLGAVTVGHGGFSPAVGVEVQHVAWCLDTWGRWKRCRKNGHEVNLADTKPTGMLGAGAGTDRNRGRGSRREP